MEFDPATLQRIVPLVKAALPDDPNTKPIDQLASMAS